MLGLSLVHKSVDFCGLFLTLKRQKKTTEMRKVLHCRKQKALKRKSYMYSSFRTERGHILKHIGSILIILGWLVMLWIQQPNDTFGTDFYPMYVASQALISGESPYGPEVAAHFHAILQELHLPFALVGFAYPLPAVVGLWPLFLLPLPAAIGVWLALGSAGSYISIKLSEHWSKLVLLPFCFTPLHRAIVVKQPTLIWFALTIVLLFAMRQHRTWLVGYCIVVLVAKPQAGLLFSIAGLFWAGRFSRRTFGVFLSGVAASRFSPDGWRIG